MTLTSTRSMISVISLWGSIAAGQAYADCSNLVLKMQDPVSKREMTSIFNCHEPSLSVPGATTSSGKVENSAAIFRFAAIHSSGMSTLRLAVPITGVPRSAS
jgi:hypothetical protein